MPAAARDRIASPDPLTPRTVRDPVSSHPDHHASMTEWRLPPGEELL